MRYRVLGPVEVDGADLGQPKQRLVWATLLCRAGRVVSDDHLVDALWGGVPPRSAVTNLRVYVTSLRKIVGDDVLQRKDGGYVVAPKPGQLDAAAFEELLTQARASQDPKEKKDQYEQAMALWRGSAFGSVADHPSITHAAQALEELRLAAVEELAEVRLALGEHAALAAELGGWVASHPLREGLHARLMLALYRSDRQAEALEAYQRARQLLADELGLEPGPALQDLQQAILRSDPAHPGAALESPADRRMAVPAELPADLAGFTGRTTELLQLHERLLDKQRPVAISAISGAGGVGKSALAIHLGHQLIDQFPDGQLYVNLQGSTPEAKPLDPIDALGRLLRSLGVAPEAVPTDVDEAAALLRTRTHGRRLLIILDNARDTPQIRPLLPGSETCAVVITSRRALSLDAVHHLALDLLTPDEARALLSALTGMRRTGAEPEATKDIVRLCGYLPLAISIAAARLNSRITWNLAKLADRLMVEERRLSELEQGDRAVRASLEVSYSHLDYPHARAFRLCALPGGPDLDSDAAAALLDLAEPDAEDLLDDLVDLGLLQNPTPGTYRYHDLLRLLAHEQAANHEPEYVRNQALHRLLAHYSSSTKTAIDASAPTWDWPQTLLAPERQGRGFSSPEAAREWLLNHVPHLVAAAECGAHRPESLGLSADQAYGLGWFIFSGVSWTQIAGCLATVVEAAALAGDQRSEALGLTELGRISNCRYLPADAAAQFERATRLALAVGDQVLLWQTWENRGLVYRNQQRPMDAIHALQEAATLTRRLGRLSNEATVLASLARAHIDAGQRDEAFAVLDQALHLARDSGEPEALAAVRYARGVAFRDAGRFQEAVGELADARQVFRKLAQQTVEGYVLYHLAETYRRCDRHAEAIHAAQECLRVSREISDDHNVGRTLAVLGQAQVALGDREIGRANLQQACRIFARLEAAEAGDIRKLLEELT
ncbi:tetratricopeptide repeat protein [Nonomuraea sp. K274]|uniref:Tetratricopeptide repeat protein n=1 Tax=Nonomuraea cypriaca TaxID=1187855 RepID=A0A931A7D3_9ACTN|nr:AfsR/SARP family transcriptional regulator [Nonomuraea cypriaca]MBF8187706.1 tetratricopeptide repeat protein [Nonomuraea cypriaca]